MGKSTTQQKVKSQEKEILNGISRADLYEFFADEKITKLLQQAYEMAQYSEDEKVRADMIKDILDRYFGKAQQRVDNTSSDGSFKSIFIGDLKD